MAWSLPHSRSGWSRLWQVPTLLLGLGVFGYGSYALYQHHARQAIPFETHLADARRLLEQKDYAGLISYINTLANHFGQPDQRAQLEVLAGDVSFMAAPDPANYQSAIDHYSKARQLGWPHKGMTREQAQIDEHWGAAAMALGDYPAAIDHLEKALALNPTVLKTHGRDLIDAYQRPPRPNAEKALALLEKIGLQPGDVDQQVWALTKRLELLNGSPTLEKAAADARVFSHTIKELEPCGRLLTGVGRAEFEMGQLAEAQKDLLEARKHFLAHKIDDGRAALLLGKIAQAKAQYGPAKEFYQEVVTTHAGTPIFAAGRFGRAEVLALENTPVEPMEGDYRFAINAVLPTPGINKPLPEMLTATAIRTALAEHTDQYQQAGKLDTALQFIQLQRLFNEPDSAEMTFREAAIHEQRAVDLAAQAAALPPGPAHDDLYQQSLVHYGAAAECLVRHAKLATMQRDASARSLWKAAGFFDKAGRSTEAIATYQKYSHDFPSDNLVPEAVLNIGQLYESLGQYDKALPYFQQTILDHPNTTPAYMSAVHLGRCYMAKGEKFYPQAEQALLDLVQDNKTLQPSALEFQASIFALGDLYYRSHRWSDAILRLEEALTRYPDDPAIPQTRFWLANSYRQSAAEIAAALVKDPHRPGRATLEDARRDRLERAADIYTQLIATLDDPAITSPTPSAPLSPVRLDYLRYSHLYRADCSYDLQDYRTAIKLYDAAASRFGQSLTAVEAYVQIVNAYLALQEPRQAAAAAERARWILQRVPDEAFGQAPLALGRAYFEDVLRIAKP